MIRIRKYTHEDNDKLKAFCDKHKIAFPAQNIQIFLAVLDKEIVGVGGIKLEYKFEPLICENPLAANKLARMVEGAALGTGINILTATVPGGNEKHIAQLEKEGFIIIDKNITLLEKNYG